MKRLSKILGVLLAITIMLCTSTAFATEYVFDESNEQYITANESNELDAVAKNYRDKYGFGIYYYYSNQVNGDLVSFCEDYWQRYCKNDENGVLLALTDDSYYVYLVGDAKSVLNGDAIWSTFSDPKWTYYYDAVCAYIEYVGEAMATYYDGNAASTPTDEPQPVDSTPTDNENEDTNKLIYIGGSVLLCVLAAFIFIKSVKSKHKTVNKKSSANDYVIPGSLNITQSYEAFLYKNVTKTEKQQNNNQQAKK